MLKTTIPMQCFGEQVEYELIRRAPGKPGGPTRPFTHILS